jgi:murein DD-endopeptidase MepM/ murein hydrolase activator NlpD
VRRVFFVFGLVLFLLHFPLPAQAAKKQTKAAASASMASGARLVCPDSVGIGEPFLVRVELPRSVAKASLTFLGRSTPLELRMQKAGQEAVALLGSDVLDARPGRRVVAVRLTDAAGGKARILKASVELVHVKRPVESLTLDPAMVNPPASELARIALERAQVRASLSGVSAKRLWSLPLSHPVPGELSSMYGIGRVLNGQPRSPHRGQDLEAETGDPVSAAADGVVALTGHFYYAGNSVYLDHGQGLFTMYFHLSELRVTPGEHVARGQVLGLAGATGRSTRSHLHFGVSTLGRLVDPAPLFLYDALP